MARREISLVYQLGTTSWHLNTEFDKICSYFMAGMSNENWYLHYRLRGAMSMPRIMSNVVTVRYLAEKGKNTLADDRAISKSGIVLVIVIF